MDPLEARDPEVAALVAAEERRQRESLIMIASENWTSDAVLAAQGSALTNKYAEGYPGHRYYGGCEYFDAVERLAIDRATKLFNAEHANVQPHAGSQANFSAYFALIKPGDTIMGMNLAAGGHLTHGHKVNFSGKLYNVVSYTVDHQTELIDYDAMLALAKEHRPKIIVAGASSYARIIDFERFRQAADEVGALFMVDMAHIAGLVAGGAHPNPTPIADVVTSTTHKTLRGPRSGFILCKQAYAKAIDSAVFPGTQGGPLGHVIAAKAVCFKEAAEPHFADYSRQIVANAKVLAEELIGYGFRIVTGGTDNHMFLIDVGSKGLTGKQAEDLLWSVGVVANKNAIPFDTRPPAVTSGLRVGTPALTTRGMKEREMRAIAEIYYRVLSSDRPDTQNWARDTVKELCASFPLYHDAITVR